jgi:CRP-like cAMP-binding protein
LAVSFAQLPFLSVFAKCLRAYTLNRVAICTSVGVGVTYFLFYQAIIWHADVDVGLRSEDALKITAAGYYIISQVAIAVMQSVFWESVSASFEMSDQKLSISSITYGSTFASLFIGFFFMKQLQHWGVSTIDNVLLLCVVALLISAFYYLGPTNVNQKTGRKKDDSQRGAPSEQTKVSPSAVRILLSKPYYVHMCTFELAASIGRVLADIQMLAILSHLSEAEMKNNLGYINGFQSLIMIPLQYCTGYISKQFGVLYGLGFLPLSLALFGGLTAAIPSMVVLIFTRSIYNAVTYTVFGTSRELLWLPLSVEERRTVKPLIGGMFRAVSTAVGALISLALKQLQAEAKQTSTGLFPSSSTNKVDDARGDEKIVGMCIVGISSVFMLEIFRARMAYATEFYDVLRKGGLSSSDNVRPDVHHLSLEGPTVQAIIRKTLSSGTPSQRVFLLDSLPQHVVAGFKKELQALMNNDSLAQDLTNPFGALKSHRSPSNDGLLETAQEQLNISFTEGSITMKTPVKLAHQKTPVNTKNQRTMSSCTKTSPVSAVRASSVSMSPSQRKSHRKSASINDLSSGLAVRPESPMPPKVDQHEENMNTSIRLKALEVAGRSQLLTVEELLFIICNRQLPRSMRIAAINICGSDSTKASAVLSKTLVRYMEKLVFDSRSPRTLRASAAICLLKITNWSHEPSHILLYEMMHNVKSDKKAQIAALSLVGQHLNAMIADGYLIFILNKEEEYVRNQTGQRKAALSIALLSAAIKCCNGRRSKILIPSLVKKLAFSTLVDLVCDALEQFLPEDTISAVHSQLELAMDGLKDEIVGHIEEESSGGLNEEKFIFGASRCFARLLQKSKASTTALIYTAMIKFISQALAIKSKELGYQKESSLTVIKPLATLLRQYINGDLQHHFKEPFQRLVDDAVARVKKNVDEFSVWISTASRWSADLVHGNIRVRDEVHFMLQLCAVAHFPPGLSVDLILEGISSSDRQLKTASLEVVDNLLEGKLKQRVQQILSSLLTCEEILLTLQHGSLQSCVDRILSAHLATIPFQKEGRVSMPPKDLQKDDDFIVKMQTLETSPLFEGLRLRELKEVAAVVDLYCVKKGDSIRDYGTKLFIIVRGEFIVKEGEIVNVAKQGDSIGEPPMSSFFSSLLPSIGMASGNRDDDGDASPTLLFDRSDTGLFEISASAMKDSVVIELTHSALENLLRDNSRVLHGILRTLLIRLRECTLARLKEKGARAARLDGGVDLEERDTHDEMLHFVLKRHVSDIGRRSPLFKPAGSMATTESQALEKCIRLAKSSLVFAHLDHHIIEALANIAEERVYLPGDSIFREGDDANFLFLAEDDTITIEGEEEQSLFFGSKKPPRQLYGAFALLPHSTRLKTVRASNSSPLGQTRILKFLAKSLVGLMARYREVCQALCILVASRLEEELSSLCNTPRQRFKNPIQSHEEAELNDSSPLDTSEISSISGSSPVPMILERNVSLGSIPESDDANEDSGADEPREKMLDVPRFKGVARLLAGTPSTVLRRRRRTHLM